MVEHITKHLFKHADGRSPYYHCSYKDPETKQWKVFSCRTKDKGEAGEYALARLMMIYDADKSRAIHDAMRNASSHHQLSPRSTISEFTEEYVENITTARRRRPYTPKSKRALRDSLNQLRKRYGDVKITDLTRQQGKAFIMTGQPSERTAQRHHINLRAAFRAAMNWGLRMDNPFDHFQPPVPEHDRQKWEDVTFTDELLEHLLMFMDERTFAQRRLRRLVLFAYETGMRLAELRNAQHYWVNTATKVITVRSNKDFRTKNGESRIIPLSNLALSVYEEQLFDNRSQKDNAVRRSPYLFPTVKGGPLSESTVEHSFGATRDMAFRDSPPEGFPLVRGRGRSLPTFHGLRHGFVLRLAAQGASDRQIMPVTGHKAPSTVSRYTHIDRRVGEPIREALNRSTPDQIIKGNLKLK